MPRQRCCEQHQQPCSCEMGNLYRFVEPIVLLSLARLGTTHGYAIAQEAEKLAVTHAGVDVAAIYRVLRRLEQMGYVRSEWETETAGPARRDYTLTDEGRYHLRQWVTVLGEVKEALSKIIDDSYRVLNEAPR